MDNDSFDEASFWKFFSGIAMELGLSGSEFMLGEKDVRIVPETDSTNTRLLCGARSLAEGAGRVFLLAAESQTAGRGRLGRRFYAPKSGGVYFSFLHFPEGEISSPSAYTISSCVGVRRALKRTCGADCQIKWVNDLYLRGKKICGILAEGVVDESSQRLVGIVVGIGINITSEFLPDELKEKAGGIIQGGSRRISRAELLAACAAEIFAILRSREDVIGEYRKAFMLAGKKISVTPVAGTDSGAYEAVALDVTGDGGLLVELSDGSRKILHSGEVTLH